MPRAGLTDCRQAEAGAPVQVAGRVSCKDGTIMKKVALTALVLALGLAACESKTENAVENDTTVENAVEDDAMAADNAVDNALDAADNAVENAGEAIENAADATENAADNSM